MTMIDRIFEQAHKKTITITPKMKVEKDSLAQR
jgi:hypothetical protein